MSVAELQASVTGPEFAEWCAFNLIDPATEERADLRAAQIAWVIANLFVGTGQPQVPMTTFMPYSTNGQSKRKRTPQQVGADIMRWANAQVARQERRRRN